MGDAREVDRVTDFSAWVVIRSVVAVEIDDWVETTVWARLCGAVDGSVRGSVVDVVVDAVDGAMREVYGAEVAVYAAEVDDE